MSDLDYRMVLATLADAVVVADAHDRIAYVNPAAERLLGWTSTELEKQPLTTIMPERMRHAHESGFRRYAATRDPRVMGRPIRVPALRRDGGEIDIELTLSTLALSPEQTVIVGCLRDLRDRVELERQVRVARHLQAATDAASALTAKLDVTHVIDTATQVLVESFDAALARVWLYDAAREVLVLRASRGLSNDVEHSSRAEIDLGSYPFKVAAVASTRAAFLKNGIADDPQFDREWVKREKIEAAAVFPLLVGGELRGVLVAFFHEAIDSDAERALRTVVALAGAALNDALLHDAERSARQRFEELAIENARLYAETERARTRAEEASRLKDEFLTTVSHELRTPLSAILGWASLLQTERRRDAGAVDKAMEVIERNARSQLRLIEDILDVSRIVRGQIRLETEPVDLESLIKDAIESLRPGADGKSLTIAFTSGDGPHTLVADPERLKQIVWNVLSNAVKFTPKGGEVRVSLERDAGKLIVTVEDTGCGMSPSFLPYVFHRFRQADGSPSRTTSGLGIGLAIVRHLTEMHGGSVSAESEGLGKGTSIRVVLPVMSFTHPTPRRRSSPPPRDKIARASVPPVRPLFGLRLLVVEDEPDARELIQIALSDQGAQVKTAGSAEEALASVESFRPDILVSDIAMPGHDGYWLMREVRRREPRLPAVALTAYTRHEDVSRAELAGFNRHVGKPVDPSRLVDAIAALRSG